MSPENVIDDMVFTEPVDDLLPPCDYSEAPSCTKDPAHWVLRCVPCGCGEGGFRLACTRCKDIRLLSEGGVVCGGCGTVTVPARLAYSSIEPL